MGLGYFTQKYLVPVSLHGAKTLPENVRPELELFEFNVPSSNSFIN